MIGHAAVFGEDLGVAGMADAALMEGQFIERQGRDGVDAAVQRQPGGRREELVRGPAGAGVDDARERLATDRQGSPRRPGTE